MKTTKSITIEAETWAKAKNNYDNISERIGQLIEADLNEAQEKEAETIKELKAKIAEQSAALSSLKADYAKKEKEDETIMTIQ